MPTINKGYIETERYLSLGMHLRKSFPFCILKIECEYHEAKACSSSHTGQGQVTSSLGLPGCSIKCRDIAWATSGGNREESQTAVEEQYSISQHPRMFLDPCMGSRNRNKSSFPSNLSSWIKETGHNQVGLTTSHPGLLQGQRIYDPVDK